MNKSNKSVTNLGVVIGVLGVIAGIALLIQENWVIGISGTISSAGLAYYSYYYNAEK